MTPNLKRRPADLKRLEEDQVASNQERYVVLERMDVHTETAVAALAAQFFSPMAILDPPPQ